MKAKKEIFILIPNQDYLVKFEKNKCFRNVKNYKYLFLGKGPTDKLSKYKKKVIIARDLPQNIEEHKNLCDYTGWYALAKNDIITSDEIAVVQYDYLLKENFEKDLAKAFLRHPDCLIGFLAASTTDPNFMLEHEVFAIKKSCKEVYNIDLHELVEDARKKATFLGLADVRLHVKKIGWSILSIGLSQ